VCLKQDVQHVDRPSTKGKVLKKEVSFVTSPKRQHDGKSLYMVVSGSLNLAVHLQVLQCWMR
jgi:hypothetical protein